MLKKIICLLVVCYFILGCNSNIKYNHVYEYKLSTEKCKTTEEFIESLGLEFNNNYEKREEDVDYFDYSSYYYSDEELYLFQFDNKNFIMIDLENYICFDNVNFKPTEKDIYSIDVFKDTFFSVIDKLGLPNKIIRGGNYSHYYYYVEGSTYYVQLSLNYGLNPGENLELQNIEIKKEWCL